MRNPYSEARADEYSLVHVNDKFGSRLLVMRYLFSSPTPCTVLATGTREACLAARRLMETGNGALS